MLEHKIMTGKAQGAIRAVERRRQVLVVDDKMAVRDILSRILSSWGYHVTAAGNGLQGATLFITGSYDLVITDLEMPLMDGWELSRLIKKQSPNTPVILVTGLCEDRHWEQINTSCIDAIILKPFDLHEIEKTIQRLWNSGA